jgi:2-polyprenyl-6-methoxyphenol hydroxylase-like FAD-dependent oxidoreductase
MKIVTVGGGICGLGTALLLARDGHEVLLLERDPAPLPTSTQDAWQRWERKGVVQFRQPHNFMPGLRILLEAELPDVQEALGRAGAGRFDFVNPLPPSFSDRSPRPIDEQLWTLTGRRPVCEWVFGQAAQQQPRLSVRTGVRVSELLTGTAVVSGRPHVTGVRTAAGEEIRADLVVDASGRQSACPQWLTAIGAPAPYEVQADSGFTYYTRYFAGTQPERIGPALTPFQSISLLTLPGDNGTWSITVFTASGDQPLKALRNEEAWTRTVRACPLQAHWLDGEPITPVLPMSGIVDRYRRFVVDGIPVATGIVGVADAWACTNPSAGRGMTVGMLHARHLRDVLRTAAEGPRSIVEEFDRRTEAHVAPWYHAQIAADQARFAEMDAVREGRPVPQPGALAQQIGALFGTMMADPDLFRAALEYVATITPVQTILERPAVAERMAAVRRAMSGPPPAIPGPNRAQVLQLIA